jgi:enamine deaminase RidA (YjgF/YER057c/UK114 family)
MSRLMPIQPEKATGKAKELLDVVQELLQDVFGKDKNPSRLVNGVASLPLGTPVELEIILEVSE